MNNLGKISEVNTANMYRMADMLDTIPAQDFNLALWVARMPGRVQKFMGLFSTECGFAGCAMGWAAHNKTFEGLKIYNASSEHRGVVLIDPSDPHENIIASGFSAAVYLFGIDNRRAEWFFSTGGYDGDGTPMMVADRLRRFAVKVDAIQARPKRPDISELKKFTEVKSPVNA